MTADGSKLLYGRLGEHNLYARAVAGDLRNNAEELLVTDSAYPSGAAAVADEVFYFGYVLPGEPATIRFYDYATRETHTIARVPGTPFEVSSGSFVVRRELLCGSHSRDSGFGSGRVRTTLEITARGRSLSSGC